MLAKSLASAIKNLLIPAIMKIFLVSILLYIIGWGFIAWGISSLVSHYSVQYGADGFIMGILSTFGGFILAWFLFPLLYPVLISFFDEKIVTTIERENYPHITAREPPFWPSFGADILFSLKAIGLNILCLPLYIIPVVGIFIYYWLNGHLLGTQFFRIAAGRHISFANAEAMQIKHRWQVMFTGIMIIFCATIPIINLAAPVLGVATMLHLFHNISGNNKATIL